MPPGSETGFVALITSLERPLDDGEFALAGEKLIRANLLQRFKRSRGEVALPELPGKDDSCCPDGRAANADGFDPETIEEPAAPEPMAAAAAATAEAVPPGFPTDSATPATPFRSSTCARAAFSAVSTELDGGDADPDVDFGPTELGSLPLRASPRRRPASAASRLVVRPSGAVTSVTSSMRREAPRRPHGFDQRAVLVAGPRAACAAGTWTFVTAIEGLERSHGRVRVDFDEKFFLSWRAGRDHKLHRFGGLGQRGAGREVGNNCV